MRHAPAAAVCALFAGLWWLAPGGSPANAAAAGLHQISGGSFEASGVVHVRDTGGVPVR